MKRFLYRVICFSLFLAVFTSCSTNALSSTPTQTQEPAEATTATIQPSATPTIQPSPTSIPYPGVLDQTFTRVNIIYRDEFGYKMQGQKPLDWVVGNQSTVNNILVGSDSTLRVISTPKEGNWGTVFYYVGEILGPGEGVYFKFKFLGNQDTVTWGMDNVDEQGNLFEGGRVEGYYSVAMQMLFSSFNAHVIEGPYLKDDSFSGDLKIEEDTWYDAIIAQDLEKNFLIKVWNNDQPDNQLIYLKNWPNSADNYIFTGWMSSARQEWLDDFTIFTFDSITSE